VRILYRVWCHADFNCDVCAAAGAQPVPRFLLAARHLQPLQLDHHHHPRPGNNPGKLHPNRGLVQHQFHGRGEKRHQHSATFAVFRAGVFRQQDEFGVERRRGEHGGDELSWRENAHHRADAQLQQDQREEGQTRPLPTSVHRLKLIAARRICVKKPVRVRSRTHLTLPLCVVVRPFYASVTMQPAVLVVLFAAAAALASDSIVFGGNGGSTLDSRVRLQQNQRTSTTRRPTTTSRRITADDAVVFMPDQIGRPTTPNQPWSTSTKKPDAKVTTQNQNSLIVSKTTTTTTETWSDEWTTTVVNELPNRLMANAPTRDCPPGHVRQRQTGNCRRIIS
jgi:hypothetical protein